MTTPKNKGKKIGAWAGFINGKLDYDGIFKTKADAEIYYEEVRKVEILIPKKN